MSTTFNRLATSIDGLAVALPLWNCHKTVQAVKIKSIAPLPEPQFSRPVCRGCVAFNSACGHCERCRWRSEHSHEHWIIAPEEVGIPDIAVSPKFVEKHKPVAGGYFVVYVDGYESFSPAEAFESGYTRA